VAGFLAERARRLGEVKTVLGTIGLVAVPGLLVFIQPDIGTSLVYGAALVAMLFIAGARWLHLGVILFIVAFTGALVVWLLPSAGVDVLEPYQRDRLTAFVNRTHDPQGASYNVQQSILAIGAGGVRGRGVENATQTNLDYLPEHATDFAFASLAEQRGFIGAAILLLLYLLVVWRGLRVVTYASDPYSAIAAGGIVFALMFQVFVNVGMTMGIAPVTGIPLPFVSVGGVLARDEPARGRRAPGDPRARAPAMKLPLAPAAVFDAVRELRSSAAKSRPIVLGGARSLVDALRRELLRDGDPSAIRDASLGALDGAAALVYVLAGEPTEEDERALRSADMANVPIVVLGPEPTTPIPYVLATDILPLPPGEGFPLEDLGRLLGAKADDVAPALAAKLPSLRRGIAESLVAKVSRQNGLIGAAVFIPGGRLPGAHAQPAAARDEARDGVRAAARRAAPARGARSRRHRARAPRDRARCARGRPRRRVGGEGRRRVHRDARARRGGDPLLRGARELGRGGTEPGAPGADRA
jgi:hypothetical protein